MPLTMTRKTLIIGVAIGVGALVVVIALAVGLGVGLKKQSYGPSVVGGTPAMGWNSWNKYHCDGLNEQVVKASADGLVSSGLDRVGFKYVILDDCWQLSRNASGHLQADSSRFPKKGRTDAMKALGDYLHSKGLRLGLTTSVGSLTCQRRPGSYGHQVMDAKTFAAWGVDFLREDDCYIHPGTHSIFTSYSNMTDAIRKAGRKMVLSVESSVPISRAASISHMRRIGEAELSDDWDHMLYLVDGVMRADLPKLTRQGFFNDIGVLHAGNGGMSLDQYAAQISLWSILKAPLILGNDVSQMTSDTIRILTNTEVIALNQDYLGRSGTLISSTTARGSTAGSQVVSSNCDVNDAQQQWTYNSIYLQFKHPATNKCLHKEADDYISVQVCDTTRREQQFYFNRTGGYLLWFQGTGYQDCLTTSTMPGVASKIRWCYLRNTTIGWQGPNQPWHPFNEIFTFPTVGSSGYFQVKNTNDQCMRVGGRAQELQVFGGPLSGNRYAAVLLNRDRAKQDITLRWRDLGISTSKRFKVRDLWRHRDLNTYAASSYKVEVKGRACVVLLLTPA